MQKFAEQRMLHEVLSEDLYDNARIFDYKGKVRVKPYYTPMVLADPLSRTLPQTFEDGFLRVEHKDPIEFVDDEPADNADAVYIAVAQVRVVQIVADVEATGVAARAATVAVTKLINGAGLVNTMVTGAVALTDGQDGSISMLPSGPTWLNDNGVITNEDTNVSGLVLQPGDNITLTWTNKDADDRGRLSVAVIELPVI